MEDRKTLYVPEEPPLDEEEVEMSLVPVTSQPFTMIDVDQAEAAYKAYVDLCNRILDDKDYATISGRKARKRSGWAKLRRFYGISAQIIKEERVPPLSEWEPGQTFMYRFTVEAQLGFRIEHGDGACESEELAGSNISPTEHNVRAKALTRAKNRATSDLIGGGEVSAEELENGPTPKPGGKSKHWIEYSEARKKFWVWAREELSLTDEQVHEALGVKSVKDYQGSMAEAKKQIEEWIAAQMVEEAE